MPEAPSLYRRHRPRTFSQVVGQEHVVRTLRNAVEQGKVHHAYLFVGSRGTGKTSMAKILAACLNCENGGPTTEPCGVCDSCVSIASATSLDVIEMDAASNNSVDDIRDLRDRVAYAPVSGKDKVYILDEAHMLSSQAWNAFLKTLEEPPPHTIFVLATTEATKVLPTVVDRCHRFDFSRPSVDQIASVVGRVAAEEKIEIAPDAIALLARHATGSFRDALGTLEQLVTYSGTSISTEDVLAVLGVADADLLFAALDAVAQRDARAALLAAAQLIATGREATEFLRQLESHARDLMVVQTLGTVPEELRVTPDRDARLAEQAAAVGRADVARFIDLLAAAMEAGKNGADARTQLELALVKAAAPEVDPSMKALLARIERLESGGQVRAVAAPAPPVPETPGTPPTPAPPQAASAPQIVAPPPQQPPPARPPEASPQPVRSAPAEPAPQAAAPPVAVAEPAELDLDGLRQVWPAVLQHVREAHTLCAAKIDTSRPVGLANGTLILGFENEWVRKGADKAEYRDCLQEALRAVTGQSPKLTFELREPATEAEVAAEQEPGPSEEEILARFKAEFQAEEVLPEEPS